MRIFRRLKDWFDPPPPPPKPRDPKPACRHLNTTVYSSSTIGRGYCRDCFEEVGLEVVFSNWLDELRALKK